MEEGDNEVKDKRVRKQEPVKCTECESQAIDFDDIRWEHVCLDCGLVLSGPPAYVGGLILIDYPWGNSFMNEFDMEDEDGGLVTAFYGP